MNVRQLRQRREAAIEALRERIYFQMEMGLYEPELLEGAVLNCIRHGCDLCDVEEIMEDTLTEYLLRAGGAFKRGDA